MLRIIDRYLLRELAFGFLASAVVLLVVTLGGTIADILNKVARGRLPADLMFELLGLRVVDTLTVLLPIAVFLGVLLAYGRLWRDSEMAVFQASGLSVTGLVRPLTLLAVPVTLALALISFWLAPAAVRYSQHLVQEANRSMVVAGMEAGRFVELPGKGGVIFVSGMSPDGTRFERMFVESEREDGSEQRIDVITAARGELYHDTDGQGRFLSLRDGFRVEGRLGHRLERDGLGEQPLQQVHRHHREAAQHRHLAHLPVGLRPLRVGEVDEGHQRERRQRAGERHPHGHGPEGSPSRRAHPRERTRDPRQGRSNAFPGFASHAGGGACARSSRAAERSEQPGSPRPLQTIADGVSG